MLRPALAVFITLGLVAIAPGCGDNLDPNAGDAAVPDGAGPGPDGAVDAAVPDATVDGATPEICDNAVDDDGDALIDCADPDCGAAPGCVPELACADGLDDDGDGAIDCADPDCAAAPNCLPEAACADGIDGDLDGAIDCADSDCAVACLAGCADGESAITVTATGLPQPVDSTLPATVVDFPVSATGWISGGAVRFSITHTYDADLDVTLVSGSDGSELDLSSDNGADGDNYVETYLADSGTDPVTAGVAPFTGTFRPEAAFAGLTGMPAAGTWQVRVTDDASGDVGTVDAVELYLCVCNGTAGCESAIACLDGADNDGDTLVDCADPDCGGVAQCIPEPVCDDGVDDDLDGLVDCADPDCAGIATCEQPEATCDDGLDNDGDGFPDCADPDCTATAFCGTETDCGNGLDDDGDGLADCLDPGCDGVAGCEIGAELTCDDGLDNDGDGAIDCADTECAGGVDCAITSCPVGTTKTVYTATDLPLAIPDSPGAPALSTITIPGTGLVATVAVQLDITHTFDGDLDIFLVAPGGTRELSTDNGSSGDDYAGTVLVDSAATAITAGAAPFTGSFRPEQTLAALAGTASGGAWSLRVGDDAGGDTGTITGYQLVVCACDAASGDCEFGAAACRNGLDDDGDGLVDCAEPSCAADQTCQPEADCDDGVDDDLDGDVDCADADCDGVASCEVGAEVSCGDGFDNDADGVTDCFDADCAADPVCLVELDCGNGLDDDGDGLVDCPDPDCAADLGCAPEVDCDDGLDDDGDGDVDCLDQGCDGLDGCELGTELSCNDGFDNDGDGAADCADGQCGAQFVCAIATCPVGTSKVLYSSTEVPLAIPDNSPATPAVSTIAIPTVGIVTSVAVQVDVEHPFASDLDIFLAAPGGTRELSTDNGSSGDNYTRTVFVDSAATAITAGTAPFTGRFRPEQTLAALAETASEGSWSLRVGDDGTGDVGTLLGYELLACACDAADGCELGATACRNGLDDDGDGLIDCAEAACATDPTCIPVEHACSDGLDDDGDGAIDCADSQCAWACTAVGGACPAGSELVVYGALVVPVTIPLTTATIDAPFSVPVTGTVASAVVRFNASHTWDSDVTLSLASPMGTAVELTSGNGGSGDNYVNTVFVDTAATSITAGTAPFTGSFRPEQLLALFTAQPTAGTWTARLGDTATGDGGSWTELSVGLCVLPL